MTGVNRAMHSLLIRPRCRHSHGHLFDFSPHPRIPQTVNFCIPAFSHSSSMKYKTATMKMWTLRPKPMHDCTPDKETALLLWYLSACLKFLKWSPWLVSFHLSPTQPSLPYHWQLIFVRINSVGHFNQDFLVIRLHFNIKYINLI